MTQPLDRNAVLQQLDSERRSLARQGESLEILPEVTRMRMNDRAWHGISFSALSETDADAIVAREAAHFRGFNAPMEWKVYGHDRPGDLISRLEKHGFIIGPREAVMVLDLQSQPHWLHSAPAHPVRRVTTSADIALFRVAAEVIFQKGYQVTEGDLTRALACGSTEHRAYIGIEDNQAVSIGRLYTHPNSAFGGLYGGGSLPTHRGRGWYRAVVAARARDAVASGARYLMVDALPTSRPILEWLRFEHLTDTWPCELMT